jgi:hypothetical protein
MLRLRRFVPAERAALERWEQECASPAGAPASGS